MGRNKRGYPESKDAGGGQRPERDCNLFRHGESPAKAWRGDWGGWGAGLAGGLIAGAVIGGIASSAYAYGPGYGYYGGPGYGYYGGPGYGPAYGYAPAYY